MCATRMRLQMLQSTSPLWHLREHSSASSHGGRLKMDSMCLRSSICNAVRRSPVRHGNARKARQGADARLHHAEVIEREMTPRNHVSWCRLMQHGHTPLLQTWACGSFGEQETLMLEMQSDARAHCEILAGGKNANAGDHSFAMGLLTERE